MVLAILFSFLLSWFSLDNAPINNTNPEEEYHVIVTSGKIVNATSGKLIARGMKIRSNDRIKFASPGAKAIVLSTKRGRFVLSGKKNSSSELGTFVSEVLSPLKTNSKLSTRGLATAEEVTDFSNYFVSDTFAIIGNSLPIKVGLSMWPMDDNNFLTVRYKYGKRYINKKIAFKGNIAYFERDKIFTRKNRQTKETVVIDDTEVEFVELYHLRGFDRSKGEKGSPELLSAFKPIFLDEDELRNSFNELKPFYDQDGLSHEDKLEEYFAFVRDVYGYTDTNVLEDWLVANNYLSKG